MPRRLMTGDDDLPLVPQIEETDVVAVKIMDTTMIGQMLKNIRHQYLQLETGSKCLLSTKAVIAQ
jgi:hypothetical protein